MCQTLFTHKKKYGRLFLSSGSGRFWWPLDNLRGFYSHQKTPLHWLIDPLCYSVWINSVFIYILSQLVTWKFSLLSSSDTSTVRFDSCYPLYNFLFPIVRFLLINCIQFLRFLFLPSFFFSLSCCYFLLASVQEADMPYVGRAYAWRHTIPLGIGTAMLVCCQSKYYSLFTNIMSNSHK